MADLVLTLHWLYVLAVVLPVPFIVVGEWRKWPFVRRRAWRTVHLAMIGIVALLALSRTTCPLTWLEFSLRSQPVPESFLSRTLHDWLFWDAPWWAFAVLYTAFGLLVAGLYFFSFTRKPAHE